MRILIYTISAACGCAPVGYDYYQRSYYQPAPVVYVEPAGPAGPAWGGATLPLGYSYGYSSEVPYNGYANTFAQVRKIPTTAIASPPKTTKVAAVPLPKPDPRRAAVKKLHLPPKMVAIHTEN